MRMSILLPLVLLLTGCTDFFMREIDRPDVDFTRQLAIFSILSPQDSLLFVDVRETAPAFGPRDIDQDYRRILEGAIVTLDDGTTTHELTFLSENGQRGYAIRTEELDVEAGRSYVVTATFADLVVSGEATIPTDTFAIEDISLGLETTQNGGFQERVLSVSVPNKPGEEDYYLLIHDRLSGGNRVQRDLVDYIRGKDGLGERLQFAPVFLLDGAVNTINVCTTNEATYNYLFTRGTAFNNQENPFAEPTEIIGNAVTGIGLVGAMNCKKLLLR